MSKQSEEIPVWRQKNEMEENEMLEQLIESRSNSKQAANRLGFLSATFTIVAGLCFSGILWSLFAMNLAVGAGEFDLTALIAPIAQVEDKPEPVEQKQNQSETEVVKTTRQANMLRTDEINIVPDGVSVVPNTTRSRPKKFDIGPIDRDGTPPRGSFDGESGNGVKAGPGVKPGNPGNDEEKIPELVKPPVKPSIVRISEIINSRATYLPKPVYPQPAIAVGASGAVNVQVTINEVGRVVSAKAISGHPILRNAAENAARNAKFSPTILNGQAVKVTGVIIYNFVRN